MNAHAQVQDPADATATQLRRGPAVVQAVAVVAAGLAAALVVAAVFVFAGAHVISSARAAIMSTGGTAELAIDGLINLAAAGLLLLGVADLVQRRTRAVRLMSAGAWFCVIESVFWAARVQKGGVLWVAVPLVAVSVLVLIGIRRREVTAWLTVQPLTPSGEPKVAIGDRLRLRWNGMDRREQWMWCLIAVAVLVVLPFIDSTFPFVGVVNTAPGTDFPISLFNAARYALIAIGLNVVIGQAGLLDLGYVGFFAIGAYVTALFSSPDSDLHHRFSWLVCVPLAMGITMIFGVILGGPTLRLRGDYLAIVTLGFGEMVRLMADNVPALKGQVGFQDVAHPPGTKHNGQPIFSQSDGKPWFWLTVALIVVVLLFVGNLERSRVGRAWIAIRDDEDAAEIMGVPTFRFKMWAFVMGAAIGGLSGALYAGQIGFVNNQKFDPVTSILFVAAVVLGGAGNKVGVILGAFVISYLPDRFSSIADKKYLIFGIALITLMIFRPQGLAGARQRLLTYGRQAYRRIGRRGEQLDTGVGAFSTDSKSGAMAGGDL